MRLVAFVFMLCGLIVMIFVSKNHLNLIFISIALTGMANMMLWASQLQIANLFRWWIPQNVLCVDLITRGSLLNCKSENWIWSRKKRFTVISILIGTAQASTAFPMVLHNIYKISSWTTIWSIYAGLTALILVRTLWIQNSRTICWPLTFLFR